MDSAKLHFQQIKLSFLINLRAVDITGKICYDSAKYAVSANLFLRAKTVMYRISGKRIKLQK